ncbi:hypothetical protein LGN17_11775 [Burkholderia sp. AU30280]|uniref:hypothetical protein n=1 Tax=Burkholderia sp. AU30280 TaxID=2879628 RepID=UPI001CF4234E|nr:hypothetical protein [Burkholderia sp. AU30280]MCA8273182.1 hypothetical protein [Burkholderia sp. AU30280]
MKYTNNANADPIWGVVAGLILTAVGLGMGIFPKFLDSTGSLNDFVSSGVTIVGVFLIVYAIRETRRKHQR